MFVLDTNILTEYLKGHVKITLRFTQAIRANDPIALTTITRYEVLMRGRYQAVLTAANKEELLLAQSRLNMDESKVMGFDLLTINDVTADYFETLLSTKGMRKVGRADLLIACIALAHGATLVTRNVKDFAKVPNLKIENWAN